MNTPPYAARTRPNSDHQPRTLEDVSLSGPVRTIVVEPLEVPEPAPKPVKV
jgi:hypothetical protein